MLRTRWRKVLRDIWHNKTRTILVTLSIAVGVMGIGMISGSRAILSRDMPAAHAASNPYHAVLRTDPFDKTLPESVARTPGIENAEGRRTVSLRLAVGPDAWETLILIVVPDFDNMRISQIEHLAGAWPPPKRTVLLERASLHFLGVEIGDTVRVQLPDGEERALRVSGSVHDVSQVPTLFSGEVQGFITPETAELLGRTPDFDQLLFTVEENGQDREHILRMVETVREKVERSGRTVYGEYVPEPGKHWANDEVTAMLFLLTALGILALLLSGFLVINITSAILTQQIGQIGVMKAMGAQRGQLVSIYLGAVLIFGVLSLGVGVPLGALGALGLTRYMASLLNFDVQSYGMGPQVLLLEVGVGIVTPLVAALVPVWTGTRITVREAISSYGLGRGHFGSGWIDGAIARVRGVPRPVLLSLRNTFRRKGRLLLVLITLTLASSIFISVLSVQESLLLTLDDALRYWQYDIRVGFARPHRMEAIESEALQVPGVVAVEGWGFRDVVRQRSEDEYSDTLLMIAPPLGSTFIDPIVLEGRWLRPDDEYGVVINSDLRKEEPDLHVGGEIVLEIDERETVWRIVGLVKQPLSGPFLYVNYPTFARVTGDVGRIGSVRIETERHDAAYQAEVAQALESHFESRGMGVSTTVTTAQERQRSADQLNIIVVFLLIMAVLLAVVGGLGLMGVMSINVLERTREVGVIRAIGASNRSVLQIIIVEGIVIGLLSWLIGALLALPLGQLLASQVGQLFLGTPASYVFSGRGALLWLLIVVALSALASFLPAWNASRVTVRDTLAYQ